MLVSFEKVFKGPHGGGSGDYNWNEYWDNGYDIYRCRYEFRASYGYPYNGYHQKEVNNSAWSGFKFFFD